MSAVQFETQYPSGLLYVARVVGRRCGLNSDEALDVAQGAWGKAFERLGQFRGAASRMKVWVVSIAINEVRSRFNRSQMERLICRGISVVGDDRRQMEDRVYAGQLLAGTSAERAEILRLLYVEGYESPEVASMWKLSQECVRINAMRGKRDVRAYLGRAA